MAKTFRMSDEEVTALTEIALRLNRELVKLNKMPLKDTEFFHEILRQTLIKGEIELSRDGELKVNTKK